MVDTVGISTSPWMLWPTIGGNIIAGAAGRTRYIIVEIPLGP